MYSHGCEFCIPTAVPLQAPLLFPHQPEQPLNTAMIALMLGCVAKSHACCTLTPRYEAQPQPVDCFTFAQGLTDQDTILRVRKLAVDSLSRLEDYSGMKKTSTEWSVSLQGAM